MCDKSSCPIRLKEISDMALFPNFACHLKVLTFERDTEWDKQSWAFPQLASGVSWSCTQCSFNQVGMVWQLLGPISIYVLWFHWFKTGRMWHLQQPVLVCFWYVCFDSRLRPHSQDLFTQADPKTGWVWGFKDKNRGHIICQIMEGCTKKKKKKLLWGESFNSCLFFNNYSLYIIILCKYCFCLFF